MKLEISKRNMCSAINYQRNTRQQMAGGTKDRQFILHSIWNLIYFMKLTGRNESRGRNVASRWNQLVIMTHPIHQTGFETLAICGKHTRIDREVFTMLFNYLHIVYCDATEEGLRGKYLIRHSSWIFLHRPLHLYILQSNFLRTSLTWCFEITFECS